MPVAEQAKGKATSLKRSTTSGKPAENGKSETRSTASDAAWSSSTITSTNSTSKGEFEQATDSGSPLNMTEAWKAEGSPSSPDSCLKEEAKKTKRREPSKCPYCPVVMTRCHDLRRHVEKLHQGEREFLCHMCETRSPDITTYLVHDEEHLRRCPYCGFYAKNYRGLPRHMAHCRSNPDGKRESAKKDMCGK